MPPKSSSFPARRKQGKKVAKAGPTKSGGGRQFFPPKSFLKEKAARLTRFPTHRLEDLIGCTPKNSKTQVTAELIKEIRRRTKAQLDQLVKELGVDPQHTDKWQRAFHELAAIHHGVGIISWVQPRRPNRNAATKSTDELDRRLYGYMKELENQGKSGADAFEIIAKDPEKCRLLKLSSKPDSQTPDVKMKAEALRKRWSRIEKMAPPGLLAAISGDFPIYGSEEEQRRYKRITLASMPD